MSHLSQSRRRLAESPGRPALRNVLWQSGSGSAASDHPQAHNRRQRFHKGRVFSCVDPWLVDFCHPPLAGHTPSNANLTLGLVGIGGWGHMLPALALHPSWEELTGPQTQMKALSPPHGRAEPCCWALFWAWLCIVNSEFHSLRGCLVEPFALRVWGPYFSDISQMWFVVRCPRGFRSAFSRCCFWVFKFQRTSRLGCVTFSFKLPHFILTLYLWFFFFSYSALLSPYPSPNLGFSVISLCMALLLSVEINK